MDSKINPNSFSLSFPQRGVWFGSQRKHGSVVYNIPTVYSIRGDVDPLRLKAAVGKVVERHESLRVRITLDDEELRQVVVPIEKIIVDCDIFDLSALTNQANAVTKIIDKLSLQEFDLDSGLLLRTAIIQVKEKELKFVIVVHHIAADGYSLKIFMEDLFAFYRGISPAKISFRKFMEDNKLPLISDYLQKREAFWLRYFGTEEVVLNLPYDFPRSPVRKFNGKSKIFKVSAEKTRKIEAFVSSNKTTMLVFLLGIFKILLHKITQQEDIVVGVPFSGRNDPRDAHIGMFVNTVVIKSAVNEMDSFKAFLTELTKNVIQAHKNQNYPLDQLYDKLGLKAKGSTNTLFDVMMVHHENFRSFVFDDIKVDYCEFEMKTCQCDLMLESIIDNAQLNLIFRYKLDSFEEKSIDRFFSYIELIIDAVLDNPSIEIPRIELLGQAEKEKLINGFSTNSELHIPSISIIDLFNQQVKRSAHKNAVVFGNKQLSYLELDMLSNQFAYFLQDCCEIRPNNIIGIKLERGLSFIVAVLGALKTGAAYMPIEISYPDARVSYMEKDSQCLLTVDVQVYEKFQINRDCYGIESPDVTILPEQLVYLIYTSGSTGNPKGVMMPHRAMVNLMKFHEDAFPDQKNSNVIQATSISFDVSFQEVFSTLLSGGTLYPITDDIKKNPIPLVDFVLMNDISILFLSTAHFKYLMDDDYFLCKIDAVVRHIIVAGEQLVLGEGMIALLKNSNLCLHNHYGPTETHVVIACCIDKNHPELIQTVPVIGKPINNVSVYILDKNKMLVPAGLYGEIYVGGAGLAEGYLNQPETTTKKFISNPFNSADVIYKTGDVGRWVSDGNIEYLGRNDDQVKIRGYRIEPAEIEIILAKCPLVKKTVVLVTGNKSNELKIAAYVVPSKQFDRYGILSYLNNLLPGYMIPGLLIEVPEIPLTSNGKVDKKTLLSLAETHTEDSDFIMPGSGMELKLAETWKTVLNIDTVSIKDNFFHLGGHSLSAIRLCSQIRRTMGITLFPKDIFNYPVLDELAIYLESADRIDNHAKMTLIERPLSIPLSFGQERMWFIDQLEGSIAYHIPVVLRIKGLLDKHALSLALQFLVERHEILRTVIGYNNEQGFQSVLPSSLWKLITVVCSGNETEEDFLSIINQFINKPFNLLSDYNLRAKLILVGEHESILIMNFHHIGFDGWSVPILLREIVSLYNTYCTGVGTVLETLPVQYADYAIWQRKYLTLERLSGKLDYWQRKLSGSAQLNMPFDFNKPKVHSRVGATFLFPITGKVYEDLQSYCKDRQTTLYVTLLTAFNVLLSRYSGQEDISVGTPVAGRIPAETEGLIGFFVNTVVIRSNLGQNPSFDVLLQQIKKTVLEASENEEVPFDKVVERLSKERERGINPLFQVMFSMLYKESSNVLLNMINLDVSFETTFQPTSKFDLSFYIEETDAGLEVNIEYSTELYQKETIIRMGDHYKGILCNMLKNPSGSINSFALLTAEEQIKLINHTEIPYPTDKTIVDLFEQQVARSANAIALISGETQLSYKELNERSNKLGNYLSKKGVKRGAIIPICMPRCWEMVVGMLGILKAGAAYLPIDPQYPNERIDYLIDDAQGNMLLTHSSSSKIFATRVDLLRIELDVDWAEINLEPDSKLISECTPYDLAYVIYTSGSTGKPKGVMIEHVNVVRLFCNDKPLFDFNDQDVWTLFHSFCFDFSVWEMYGALFNGARLVIVEEEVVKDISRFSALLIQHGVTVLNQTPSAFYLLQDFLGEIVEQLSLRYIIFGGEALNPVKLKPLNQTVGHARLINMYGITETTVHVTFQEITIAHLNSSKSIIGKPIPTLGVYILDQHQQPVPFGVPGELYITGAGLARGYLNLPEMTDSKFLADPFRPGTGSKMYKSGDVGKWLPDGSIEYLGRNDNQVKIRGYRIETGEIESVLIESKLVNEVVVLVREDIYGNKLIAYFTAADAVSTLKLRKVINKQLPAYYMPSAFINLPEIPLTNSGKIDRNYLAQLSMHALVGDEYREPSTELEVKIAAIWKEFLSIDKISSTDLFFNIGGSSLLVIRVITKMQQEIGIHVAIADFFTKNLADIAAKCTQTVSLNNS